MINEWLRTHNAFTCVYFDFRQTCVKRILAKHSSAFWHSKLCFYKFVCSQKKKTRSKTKYGLYKIKFKVASMRQIQQDCQSVCPSIVLQSFTKFLLFTRISFHPWLILISTNFILNNLALNCWIPFVGPSVLVTPCYNKLKNLIHETKTIQSCKFAHAFPKLPE